MRGARRNHHHCISDLGVFVGENVLDSAILRAFLLDVFFYFSLPALVCTGTRDPYTPALINFSLIYQPVSFSGWNMFLSTMQLDATPTGPWSRGRPSGVLLVPLAALGAGT